MSVLCKGRLGFVSLSFIIICIHPSFLTLSPQHYPHCSQPPRVHSIRLGICLYLPLMNVLVPLPWGRRGGGRATLPPWTPYYFFILFLFLHQSGNWFRVGHGLGWGRLPYLLPLGFFNSVSVCVILSKAIMGMGVLFCFCCFVAAGLPDSPFPSFPAQPSASIQWH